MADNTTLPVGGGGDTIRSIDHSSVKTQVVGLDYGGESGPEALVTLTTGLPVQPATGTTWAISNFPGTQPISGTVAVSNFPASQTVNGTIAATQSGAWTTGRTWALTSGADSITVAGTVAVSNSFLLDATFTGRINTLGQKTMANSTPVVLSSDQASIPVAATLSAETTKVIGTVNQGTSPWVVSGTVTTGGLTDTQLRASAVPVSLTSTTITGSVAVTGPLTDTQLRASAVPVSLTSTTITGTVAATQSGTWTVQPGNTANTTAWLVTGTGGTFPVTNAGLTNIDVALSTRLKPADTLTGVTTVATVTTITNPVTVTPPTLTKGTQGATGFSTQDLKDAGRSFVTFTATAAAGVIAEALFSLSQNKGGTVTGAVTSYTVTNGKTFRFQSVNVSVRAGAAAVPFSRVIIRSNTAGATVVGSNVLFNCGECFGIAATTGVGGQLAVPLPDGLEIVGNGTISFGIAHLDQATTNVINLTVCGYEY